MSRDSSSQTPGEEGADDTESPRTQDAHPEKTTRFAKVRMKVPKSDLFHGIAREPIRRTIHRITKDIDAVDDVEQKVGIIWHRIRWRWAFIRDPLSYLVKVAERQAMTHVLVQADRRRRFDEGVERHQPLDPLFLREQSPDIAQEIMTRAEVSLFRQSLPPRLAPVLDLYLEGRRADEIARLRGITSTTAKSYLAGVAKRAQHFLEQRRTGPDADLPPSPRKEV